MAEIIFFFCHSCPFSPFYRSCFYINLLFANKFSQKYFVLFFSFIICIGNLCCNIRFDFSMIVLWSYFHRFCIGSLSCNNRFRFKHKWLEYNQFDTHWQFATIFSFILYWLFFNLYHRFKFTHCWLLALSKNKIFASFHRSGYEVPALVRTV